MDLRHARTFVSVADLGTVSKAAVTLRIAQPALSRQLADFERELGVKLFDRLGRRLVLTNEGEQLLVHCRALLRSGEAVGEQAALLRKGDAGILRVAASPQHIESVFSGLLPRFAKIFPEVQVTVKEGSGREILEMLDRGEVHFAQNLLHEVQPDPTLFIARPLGSVDLLAACRPGLVLGKTTTIEVGQLAELPLLLLDVGFGFRRAFDSACRLAQFSPRVRFESRSPHSLVALAEAGQGVAIIPSALRTDRYDLWIYRLTYQRRPLMQQLVVLSDKRRVLPGYASEFYRLWAKYVADTFPITRPTRASERARYNDQSARTSAGKTRSTSLKAIR
jgi:DNA-binding transcriptional LysR family regulator